MSVNQDPQVLIVGNPDDAHILRVASHLSRREVATCVVGPASKNGCSTVACHLSRGAVELLARNAEGKTLSLNSVSAVWWRLKPSVDSQDSEEDRLSSDFCSREWRHTLEALDVLLAGVRWVNPRVVDRRVRYKPAQLTLAQQCGFETPPTLVSNDPTVIGDFLSTYGGMGIYKPLTWFFEPPDKILFTNQVSTELIRQNSVSVGRAPGIFQPRIPKDFELRITVVGERVFPVRIESQIDREAKLDWRRKQLDLAYSDYSLSSDFRHRLLSFHRSLGLVYGAYDFIVTPDERIIFLEVNPAGQWLWIEDLTGCPISEAMAQELRESALTRSL